MKAGFVKAPFRFEVRDVNLRELQQNEVLIKVKACSVCGHDMIMASYGAKEFVQFGHGIMSVKKVAFIPAKEQFINQGTSAP